MKKFLLKNKLPEESTDHYLTTRKSFISITVRAFGLVRWRVVVVGSSWHHWSGVIIYESWVWFGATRRIVELLISSGLFYLSRKTLLIALRWIQWWRIRLIYRLGSYMLAISCSQSLVSRGVLWSRGVCLILEKNSYKNISRCILRTYFMIEFPNFRLDTFSTSVHRQ